MLEYLSSFAFERDWTRPVTLIRTGIYIFIALALIAAIIALIASKRRSRLSNKGWDLCDELVATINRFLADDPSLNSVAVANLATKVVGVPSTDILAIRVEESKLIRMVYSDGYGTVIGYSRRRLQQNRDPFFELHI